MVRWSTSSASLQPWTSQRWYSSVNTYCLSLFSLTQTSSQLGFYAKYRNSHRINSNMRLPPCQRCHSHRLCTPHLRHLNHPLGSPPSNPHRIKYSSNTHFRYRCSSLCNRILPPWTHCGDINVTLPSCLWILRSRFTDAVSERSYFQVCCSREYIVLGCTVYGSWIRRGKSTCIIG